MKLKKYSKYKDSGVDWIGEIPEGWRVDRVKHLVDFTKYYPIGDGDHGSIKPEMYQDKGIPYVRVQNLSWDGSMKLDDIVYISNEVNLENKKSILREGDLLIAKTGATVGKLGLLNEDIKVANTTSSVGKITFNKKKNNPKFWKYSFQGKIIQDQILITAYQKSAQPGFNIDDLVEFNVITPPLKTQEKIVEFLDSKTLQIENLIEKDKKLIELLKERRISLINKAVTKGLDDSVKMKDSHVNWIGEIPESWEVRKIKTLLLNLTDGSHTSVEILNEGLPYITVNNIYEKEEFIDLEDSKKISKKDFDFLVKNGCKPKIGDILFSQIGTIGLAVEVSKDNNFVMLSSLAILTPNNKIIINRYLIYLLRSYFIKDQWKLMMAGGAVKRITLEHISNFIGLFPNIQEQQKIVEFLDRETSKIDNHIKKVEKRIELYEEYKKSLIYSVVTGKVEV